MTHPCLSGAPGCTITEPHRHEIDTTTDLFAALRLALAEERKKRSGGLERSSTDAVVDALDRSLRSQLDTARKALEHLGKTHGCWQCRKTDDECDVGGEKTFHTTCGRLERIGRFARATLKEMGGK